MYDCPMCGRKHAKDYMTFHHLLPTVDESEKGEPTIYICQTCHIVIHNAFTNEQLRTKFNTLEKLQDSYKIKEWIELYKCKSPNVVYQLKKLKRIREKHGRENRLQNKNSESSFQSTSYCKGRRKAS
jgi:hypothetical protein